MTKMRNRLLFCNRDVILEAKDVNLNFQAEGQVI